MSAYDEEFSRAFDEFRPLVEGLSDAELDALIQRGIAESVARGKKDLVVKQLRRQAVVLEKPPPPRKEQKDTWRRFKFGKKDRRPESKKYRPRESEMWVLRVDGPRRLDKD